MESPKVSVIVPVYNMEKYIGKCLDSLVSQSFSWYEAIIVNDGSSDNSARICECYLSRNQNFRMINQVNCGLGYARNTGIREAYGEYITFLDSDDYLEKDAIKRMYGLITEAEADVVVCGFKRVTEDGKYLNEFVPRITGKTGKTEYIHHLLSRGIPVNACGKMIRTSIVRENDLYFSSVPYGEDYLFNIALSQKVENVLISDYNPYFYRYTTNSMVTTLNPKYISAQADFTGQLIKTILGIYPSYVNKNQKHNYIKKELSIYIGSMFSLYQQSVYRTQAFYPVGNNTIFLFGASTLGYSFLHFYKNRRHIVFVDNDPSKWNSFFEGYEVISPTELKKRYNSSHRIIIVSMYFVEILEQLINENTIISCSEVMPFSCETALERAFASQLDMLKKSEFSVSQELVSALLDFVKE
ncbi:MAG: glycosyltransferase [Synergistaceae bacterium]|nr:glycosyltransferase [Synergistaceae bacterium]